MSVGIANCCMRWPGICDMRVILHDRVSAAVTRREAPKPTFQRNCLTK